MGRLIAVGEKGSPESIVEGQRFRDLSETDFVARRVNNVGSSEGL